MAISVSRSSRTPTVVLSELCNAQLSRRKRVPAELDARSDLPEVVRRRKYRVYPVLSSEKKISRLKMLKGGYSMTTRWSLLSRLESILRKWGKLTFDPLVSIYPAILAFFVTRCYTHNPIPRSETLSIDNKNSPLLSLRFRESTIYLELFRII